MTVCCKEYFSKNMEGLNAVNIIFEIMFTAFMW